VHQQPVCGHGDEVQNDPRRRDVDDCVNPQHGCDHSCGQARGAPVDTPRKDGGDRNCDPENAPPRKKKHVLRKGEHRHSEAVQFFRHRRQQTEDVLFVARGNPCTPQKECDRRSRRGDHRRHDPSAENPGASGEEHQRKRQAFAFRQDEKRQPQGETKRRFAV